MLSVRYAIGVPVYNQVKTIRDTLLSILNQTDPFDEIVVSENHSTDGTAEIVAEFGGRIRIVRPPARLPMIANWNYCIHQMECDWFSLLSGDDYLYPGFAAAMRRGIAESPDAVLVRGGVHIVDAKKKIIGTSLLRSACRRTRPPYTILEQLTGPKVSFACFAVAKKAWDTVGGFPEVINSIGDWAFWLRLAPCGDFIKVGPCLSMYTNVPRPGLDAERVELFLRDEHCIYTHIFPELEPIVGRKCLTSSIRFRFLLFLDYYRKADLAEEKNRQRFCEIGKLAGFTDEAVSVLLNGRTPLSIRLQRRISIVLRWYSLFAGLLCQKIMP